MRKSAQAGPRPTHDATHCTSDDTWCVQSRLPLEPARRGRSDGRVEREGHAERVELALVVAARCGGHNAWWERLDVSTTEVDVAAQVRCGVCVFPPQERSIARLGREQVESREAPLGRKRSREAVVACRAFDGTLALCGGPQRRRLPGVIVLASMKSHTVQVVSLTQQAAAAAKGKGGRSATRCWLGRAAAAAAAAAAGGRSSRGGPCALWSDSLPHYWHARLDAEFEAEKVRVRELPVALGLGDPLRRGDGAQVAAIRRSAPHADVDARRFERCPPKLDPPRRPAALSDHGDARTELDLRQARRGEARRPEGGRDEGAVDVPSRPRRVVADVGEHRVQGEVGGREDAEGGAVGAAEVKDVAVGAATPRVPFERRDRERGPGQRRVEYARVPKHADGRAARVDGQDPVRERPFVHVDGRRGGARVDRPNGQGTRRVSGRGEVMQVVLVGGRVQ
eukprot:2336934-Prymnesium_polylepis.4